MSRVWSTFRKIIKKEDKEQDVEDVKNKNQILQQKSDLFKSFYYQMEILVEIANNILKLQTPEFQ